MQFDGYSRVGKIWDFWKILEVAAATFPSSVDFAAAAAHKNLIIPAAADAAHLQLHKKFDMGARSICTHEGHNRKILGMEISGREHWENLEELGKIGI